DLIDNAGALADQPLTHPIQRLENRVGRPSWWRRISSSGAAPLRRSFRVAEVVLLPFGIGPHVFRRHQTRIVTLRLQSAAQVMRANSGLHPDQTGGMFTSRASTWPHDHLCRSTIAPRRSRPTTWNVFLPMSTPTVATVKLDLLDM